MSQYPHQPPQYPYQQPPQNFGQPPFGPPPRVMGLAVIAFVLGIVALLATLLLTAGTLGALMLRSASLVTSLIAAAGVISIVGIILGAVANGKISRNPAQFGGKGFAATGLGLSIGGIALTGILLLLYPSFLRAHELSNRSYCAANLTGILKAANVYANDNSDDFPIVLAPTGANISFGGGTAAFRSQDSAIDELYQRSAPRGNMTANLWVLVLRGYTAPKQYLCKADPNNSTIASVVSGGNYYNNFAGVENISYAAAVPWDRNGNKIGFWKAIVDASLPLMSDPGPHNGDSVSGGLVNVEGGPPTSPQIWNSPIHGGDGQVVGYSDAHASFERRPDIGYQDDNIWTQNGGRPSKRGNAPVYGSGASTGAYSRSISDYTSGGGAQDWDIYMLPARGTDGKTY